MNVYNSFQEMAAGQSGGAQSGMSVFNAIGNLGILQKVSYKGYTLFPHEDLLGNNDGNPVFTVMKDGNVVIPMQFNSVEEAEAFIDGKWWRLGG